MGGQVRDASASGTGGRDGAGAVMNYRLMKGTDLLATIKVPQSVRMGSLEDLRKEPHAKFIACVEMLASDIWPDETVSLYVDDGENPPRRLHIREAPDA